MWIILTPEIAEQVTGNYGFCNSIQPTKIKGGNYTLHISVLDYDVFSSVFEILKNCTTVETVEYEETENE